MSCSKRLNHRTLHWFRKGLRLHDNPALIDACETSDMVWPVYILNCDIITYGGNIGFNRWRFLLESLHNLDIHLRNFNSRLIIIQAENVKETLLKYVEEWKITKLTFEIEPEPHRRKRDAAIIKCLEERGIEAIGYNSHTLYDLTQIIEKNKGEPPLTYKKFQSVLKALGKPEKPAPSLNAEHFKSCLNPLVNSEDKIFQIPSLEELGIVPSAGEIDESKFAGGESVALERMERYLKNEDWVNSFEKPQTSPNSLEPSTTVLSPYITFGCLSAKTFYWRVSDVYSRAKRHSSPPVSLHGQILWREFYYVVGSVTPKFDQMKENDVCLQVPWDVNDEYLKAWSEGRTGYPFIDAIMTQLRTEGWIHHLARHAVACFLTRGDLWINWEQGLKVFECFLLDHDWSLNAGNWLWLSASAFFHAYFRVYSPISFGKKTDPNGDYIRKYVPCLAKFPKAYIFEPWLAPRGVQDKCGCIIGKNYPNPIVDHDVAKQRNIERMKKARKAKYGGESSDEKESSSNNKRKKDEKDSQKKRQMKQAKLIDVLDLQTKSG